MKKDLIYSLWSHSRVSSNHIQGGARCTNFLGISFSEVIVLERPWLLHKMIYHYKMRDQSSTSHARNVQWETSNRARDVTSINEGYINILLEEKSDGLGNSSSLPSWSRGAWAFYSFSQIRQKFKNMKNLFHPIFFFFFLLKRRIRSIIIHSINVKCSSSLWNVQ